MNKQVCFGCKYMKIWHDEKAITDRLSCTYTSARGKCITWSCPTYLNVNGQFVVDRTTADNFNDLEDYAKRRLSPKWCPYRNQTIKDISSVTHEDAIKSLISAKKYDAKKSAAVLYYFSPKAIKTVVDNVDTRFIYDEMETLAYNYVLNKVNNSGINLDKLIPELE